MYVLEDLETGVKLLFNSLKELYDYLWTQFVGVEAIKLSENKANGWDVKYQIGFEWYQSLMWTVNKLQETENVSKD